MNRTICLVCFLITRSVIGLCQGDTVYYDYMWNKGTFENADYYRVIHKEGEKYKIDNYFLNNKLLMTGYFTDLKKETKTGFFVYYYKHGHKKEQGFYEHDMKTGKWEGFYDTTGNIWYTENYIKDKRDGELVSYYRSGKIKRREKHNYDNSIVTGKCFDEEGKEIPFTPFETLPKPLFDYNEFLTLNFHYPELARSKGIEGRVKVKFLVNEDGSVSDISLLSHVGGGCDQEAYRVVSSMPKWTPGTEDDKIVKVYFNLPIVFRLVD